VKPEFLQTNADYYNAAVYSSQFDNSTVQQINNWVELNTDGMIDKILEEINPDMMMYLINAVAFDAEWKDVYNLRSIKDELFTDISGNKQTVAFMTAEEQIYLDDGKATGFVKPYENDRYSFAALLPNEGISIDEYIETLTGAELISSILQLFRSLIRVLGN